jgi:biopolymer transport protein ExbB
MNELIDFIGFFSKSGPFMWPILLCSVVSVAVLIERGFALRRVAVLRPALVTAIERFPYGGETSGLEREVLHGPTVLDRLVRTALSDLPWTKFENAEALQTKARAEIARLERGLVLLEICVGIGPLLGLLGTVSGLIVIFGGVGDQSVASQGITIARGISEALHCTVAGLSVAIPSLIGFGIYTRRVENHAVDLENLCADLLNKLYTEASAPVASAAAPASVA